MFVLHHPSLQTLSRSKHVFSQGSEAALLILGCSSTWTVKQGFGGNNEHEYGEDTLIKKNSTSRYRCGVSVLRQSIADADSHISLVLPQRQHIALEPLVLDPARIFLQLASCLIEQSAEPISDFIARCFQHLRLLRYIVHDFSI